MVNEYSVIDDQPQQLFARIKWLTGLHMSLLYPIRVLKILFKTSLFMKCCEKSFGPKNEKEDRGQKKLEKKIEKKENKRSMSNSDNTKYWSCNDMMIILLQYDDHHLQFANCCFNHFLTKLADCSMRKFVCNFCKSLRIISLYVLQPFFWIILYQIFKLLF